MADVMMRKA